MSANEVIKTLIGIGSLSIPIPAGVASVTTIARSRRFALGQASSNAIIDALGNAWAFGYNVAGDLGVGDVTPRSSPVLVLGGLNFVSIVGSAITNDSLFGITTAGTAYGWGNNLLAQLGVGDQVKRSSPVLVLGGLKWKKIISNSTQYTMGLTIDGRMYGWGTNISGQLGLGDVTPRSSPVLVLGGLNFSDFSSVYPSASGANGAIVAITSTGTAYAWGINSFGEAGTGAQNNAYSSPILILGGLTWKQLSHIQNGSQYSVIGLTSTGAAYAFGYNTDGQLGVGDTTNRSSPVLVLGGLTFTKIFTPSAGAAGAAFAFGLTAAGALYGWGLNPNGNLGVGNTTPRSSPVLVLGGLTFCKMAGDKNLHTSMVALTTTGVAYSWGANTFGQLGLGDVVPRSSPVIVLGGLTFSDVVGFTGNSSNGVGSFFGLTPTGLVYAWGDNNRGQLGLGDVVPRSSPVLVLGSLVPSTVDVYTTTRIAVTPGTTYTLDNYKYQAYFNNIGVGANCDQVQVIFQQ